VSLAAYVLVSALVVAILLAGYLLAQPGERR
jgi:hypothetical protein